MLSDSEKHSIASSLKSFSCEIYTTLYCILYSICQTNSEYKLHCVGCHLEAMWWCRPCDQGWPFTVSCGCPQVCRSAGPCCDKLWESWRSPASGLSPATVNSLSTVSHRLPRQLVPPIVPCSLRKRHMPLRDTSQGCPQSDPLHVFHTIHLNLSHKWTLQPSMKEDHWAACASVAQNHAVRAALPFLWAKTC